MACLTFGSLFAETQVPVSMPSILCSSILWLSAPLQGDAGGWLQDHCLQTGDAFLIVFSVTDRRSFSKVPETLLRLRAGRPHHDLPVILVGNKSDLARSREVSLEGVYPEPIVYLKSQEMTFQALPPREAFYSSLVYDRMHLVPGLGNSPTTQPLGSFTSPHCSC